jgi:DNA-binding NarL/FixJ family response regulator
MNGPEALPLAAPGEPVRYVLIDDESAYRRPLDSAGHLEQVGGYASVEAFIGLQQRPLHVVVLDLCLNRLTGDKAVLQGVRAVRQLTQEYGQRILIHTADERPEPVARCVAAGAVGYISKYNGDDAELAQAVDEVGRTGSVITSAIHDALRQIVRRSLDLRLSESLEATLRLLGHGMTDVQVAAARNLSPRTIEDHKRKILELFGTDMAQRRHGFSDLAYELGIADGDIVNDRAAQRPRRGIIARAMPWAKRTRQRPSQPST